MPKTTKSHGATNAGVASPDAQILGKHDFSVEPTIGGVGTREYVRWIERSTLAAEAVAENLPRAFCTMATLTALTSGQLRLIQLPLRVGQVVTSLRFTSVGAATNPSHQWFGLFDGDRNALRFTSNDLTTAWGSNTRKTLALSSPYTASYSGLYYAGVLVVADTTPTVSGVNSVTTVNSVAPVLGGNTSDTGLTTPPALPFTAGSITAGGGMPYVVAL